jgi:hypothetical protein
MADKDALPASGYRGTHDPGQPTNLMQPQINPAGPATGRAAGSATHPAATKQGGTSGATNSQARRLYEIVCSPRTGCSPNAAL